MTTTECTKIVQPLALYRLGLEVGNVGTPGVPILHLGLLVHTVRDTVTGYAKR